MVDQKRCTHKREMFGDGWYWCPDCGALLGCDPPKELNH
jgi:hypothetical protein